MDGMVFEDIIKIISVIEKIRADMKHIIEDTEQ